MEINIEDYELHQKEIEALDKITGYYIESVCLEVEASYSGRYHPASNYEPAEYPELEVESSVVSSMNVAAMESQVVEEWLSEIIIDNLDWSYLNEILEDKLQSSISQSKLEYYLERSRYYDD
jgi:hypothetical protein